MSVINSIPLIAAGDDGYQISRSVRLRSSASAYFNRTPGSAGNRRTFTVSMWVKRGLLDANERSLISAGNRDPSYQNMLWLNWSPTGQLRFYGDAITILTTPVYRDPSAWYHIVLAVDTTQATASNRVRLYVNSVEVTAFSTANYPSQNYDFHWNNTTFHEINRWAYNQGVYGDQYLAEVHSIDGQALTPSSFGETDTITGVWKPKKYAGTYGTNGFYLNFSDNSAATAAAIGKDSSGNGNNWTPNNISVTAGVTYDSMIDVPTMYADGGNGRGNYSVINPLDSRGTNTVSNGNLTYVTGTTFNLNRGTIAMTSGKWYWEVTSFSGIPGVGVSRTDVAVTNAGHDSANGWAYFGDTGNKWNNNSGAAYGSSFGTTDVIGVALDMDAGTLTFYKNGTSQGTAFSTGLAGQSLAPMLTSGLGASGGTFNFGQRPFAYTPPTGFLALNTQNLPEPTIKKGNQYFDATTYTGNGTSQSIVNAGGFQPDLVWTKGRSINSNNWVNDSARGATKYLAVSGTSAEGDSATTISALNSNGYSVGSSGDWNQNAATFVGWQWKKGATPGFDIVTYTGNGTSQNIAHSLGVAPRMIIAKRRNGAQNWFVGHGSLASWSSALEGLNTTAAVNNGATAVWNATAPTSSVFSVGTDLSASGGTYVAYLFAEVAGFSKFGSYTGNGSADGPFVYCGFRPKFVMIKRTDNVGDWWVHDSARDTYNVERNYLMANTSAAEAATDNIDFLSNGFKLRVATFQPNTNGGNFIFMAFAESPFKNSLAR